MTTFRLWGVFRKDDPSRMLTIHKTKTAALKDCIRGLEFVRELTATFV